MQSALKHHRHTSQCLFRYNTRFQYVEYCLSVSVSANDITQNVVHRFSRNIHSLSFSLPLPLWGALLPNPIRRSGSAGSSYSRFGRFPNALWYILSWIVDTKSTINNLFVSQLQFCENTVVSEEKFATPYRTFSANKIAKYILNFILYISEWYLNLKASFCANCKLPPVG